MKSQPRDRKDTRAIFGEYLFNQGEYLFEYLFDQGEYFFFVSIYLIKHHVIRYDSRELHSVSIYFNQVGITL